MLSHLPGEKSPLTSSAAHCTSWGKGDDGKVLLTLQCLQTCIYLSLFGEVLEAVLSDLDV